jgi:hypothetical protein
MRTITNVSLQGFEIYLLTEKGTQTYWLKPKEYLTVPHSYLSPQLKNLVSRRLLKIQEAV